MQYTLSEEHTTRSPIQGEPLVEVDRFVTQKAPLEREVEQLGKRQTLDSVAWLETEGEGAWHDRLPDATSSLSSHKTTPFTTYP